MNWIGTLFVGLWLCTLAWIAIRSLRRLRLKGWFFGLAAMFTARLILVETGWFKEGDPLGWAAQVGLCSVVISLMTLWIERSIKR